MPEFRESAKTIFERFGRYNEQYSQMNIEDKLAELEKLKQRKRGIERGLNVTNDRILLLEHMPEVAEYKVKRDKLAMSLLKHLIEKGDSRYADLEVSNDYLPVFFHYISLFRTAQLIEIKQDLATSDDIIKLTERGRSLQYADSID